MIRYLKIYVEISFTNEYAPYRTLFQYEKLYPLFYILCFYPIHHILSIIRGKSLRRFDPRHSFM